MWFHVDKHSSAHVYVRLPRGPIRKQFRETGRLDHLPQGALEDLCQLTKANSISGCKVTCDIVYTAWENLHKRGDMDTGTIGFKDQKKVIKVPSVERIKEITNRIEKTKREEVTPHARQTRAPSLRLALLRLTMGPLAVPGLRGGKSAAHARAADGEEEEGEAAGKGEADRGGCSGGGGSRGRGGGGGVQGADGCVRRGW